MILLWNFLPQTCVHICVFTPNYAYGLTIEYVPICPLDDEKLTTWKYTVLVTVLLLLRVIMTKAVYRRKNLIVGLLTVSEG